MTDRVKIIKSLIRFALTGLLLGCTLALVAAVRYSPALQSNEELLLAWHNETDPIMKEKYILYIFERDHKSTDLTFRHFLVPLAIRAYAQTGQIDKFNSLVQSFFAEVKNEQTPYLYLTSWNEALIKNQQFRASTELIKTFERRNIDTRLKAVLEKEKQRLEKACPDCFGSP